MIRPARLSDAPQIAAIYNHYVKHSVVTFETEPLAVDDIRARMRNIMQEGVYLVYQGERGKIEGFCYSHLWKERQAFHATMETTVYVENSCHGKGVGTELMTELIEECRTRNVHVLVACITSGNNQSIELHTKLGFRKASHFHEVGTKFGILLDIEDYEYIIK